VKQIDLSKLEVTCDGISRTNRSYGSKREAIFVFLRVQMKIRYAVFVSAREVKILPLKYINISDIHQIPPPIIDGTSDDDGIKSLGLTIQIKTG
jgi:hypothetical protein